MVPNVVLCGGSLAVHVVSTVLVPAAAFYSPTESLIASSPELSITAEAYFLTRALRESFLVTPQDQTVSAQQQAIIIPPLLPRGSLPLPLLPESGMCFPGEVIPNANMRTIFAPTNLAWKNFFTRVGLSKVRSQTKCKIRTKGFDCYPYSLSLEQLTLGVSSNVPYGEEQVFSDPELLLSTLQYSEVLSTGETTPISADGVLAGSRYFTYKYVSYILAAAMSPSINAVFLLFVSAACIL